MYKRFVPVTPDMLTFPYVKRFYNGAGSRDFVKLASQMADRNGPTQKRGMWSNMQNDPRAGMLLMKAPNLGDFGGQGLGLELGQGLGMYQNM